LYNSFAKKNERRSAPRFDFMSTIEYSMDASEVAGVHKAVTIDISTAGIRTYMFTHHPLGERIRINTRLPIDCGSVTVSWVNKIQEDFYMVGLKCEA
jgi:hypothetical protein